MVKNHFQALSCFPQVTISCIYDTPHLYANGNILYISLSGTLRGSGQAGGVGRT